MHWPMVVTSDYMQMSKVQVELTFVQALFYDWEFFWSTVLSILPLVTITFINWVFLLMSACNWEIVSSSVFFPIFQHQVHQLYSCQVSLYNWEMTSSSVFLLALPTSALLTVKCKIALMNWVFLLPRFSQFYPTGNRCATLRWDIACKDAYLFECSWMWN